VTEVAKPVRTRDPARKQRILIAAADLVARHGYHAVGMADIGAAAGVTGPAVYRHFGSKSAVLVALFDRVIDSLLDNASRIVDEADDVSVALALLVRDQVTFAIDDREVLQVYMKEINNLPEEDRRRLRRKQRVYLEEWVHVLGELRPELGDAEARALVHAAVGVIQSVLNYQSGLPGERLAELVTGAAHAALGVPTVLVLTAES
jgi:AcrR family transcriptional regulator